MPEGRNCSCVWSFWCSVASTVTVQRGSVLDFIYPARKSWVEWLVSDFNRDTEIWRLLRILLICCLLSVNLIAIICNSDLWETRRFGYRDIAVSRAHIVSVSKWLYLSANGLTRIVSLALSLALFFPLSGVVTTFLPLIKQCSDTWLACCVCVCVCVCVWECECACVAGSFSSVLIKGEPGLSAQRGCRNYFFMSRHTCFCDTVLTSLQWTLFTNCNDDAFSQSLTSYI